MIKGRQPAPISYFRGIMLICFILAWGRDIYIKPTSSFQEAKDLKNRLNLPDVDYVVYDSGYLTPFNLDPWAHQLDEEEQIELFGNPAHRKPAYDSNTAAWLRRICKGHTRIILFPCGMARHNDALRVDRDPTVRPDIIADLRYPPFKHGTFEVLICDPPPLSMFNHFKWVLQLKDIASEMVILSSPVNLTLYGWKKEMYATVTHKLAVRLWYIFTKKDRRLIEYGGGWV